MDVTGNPWKLATIGMALVVVTAVVTTLIVAGRSGPNNRQIDTPAAGSASPALPQASAVTASSPAVTAPPQPQPAVPSRATIDACNRYAAKRPSQKDKTFEVVKDTAIGGAIGAAVGAAGGAIADGGNGAGKGAGIGGVVGLGGGVLYGLNENKKHDEQYRRAYDSCLRAHGHGG
jgi:hypothetical protein